MARMDALGGDKETIKADLLQGFPPGHGRGAQ